MSSQINPEIGQSIQTGAIVTNYHDIGIGEPVLLLHGSGPGVSAWANWRLTINNLRDDSACWRRIWPASATPWCPKAPSTPASSGWSRWSPSSTPWAWPRST